MRKDHANAEKNPIYVVRKARRESRAEFAEWLGINERNVELAENGHVKRPRKILQALAERGHDLTSYYTEWRARHAQEMRRRMLGEIQ